jgi:hypothetical protein
LDYNTQNSENGLKDSKIYDKTCMIKEPITHVSYARGILA